MDRIDLIISDLAMKNIEKYLANGKSIEDLKSFIQTIPETEIKRVMSNSLENYLLLIEANKIVNRR